VNPTVCSKSKRQSENRRRGRSLGELISDVDDAEVLDAGLISSAQAVEHYEITRYGTLAAFARRLGRDDCTRILAETLAEEKATAKRLTELADRKVNQRAAAE